MFPGAEFSLASDRDPGEYSRTWFAVYGGRSYCEESEEFETDVAYADVVAWYREELDEKGLVWDRRPGEYQDGFAKSESWVVTDTRDEQVTVTVARPASPEGVPYDFTFITFTLHRYLGSADECQTTFRID